MAKKILYAASTFGHLRSFHIPYLEALLGKGYEVHAIGAGSFEKMPRGVICTEMGFEKKFSSVHNFRLARQIRKMVKAEKFDIISVHTALAAFFVRLAVLFLRGRPYVINTVHGYLFDEQTPAKKRRVLLWAEKLVKPVTDCLAVMNQQDYEIAEKYKLYKGKLVMTRGMGVDLSWYEPNRELLDEGKKLRSEMTHSGKELVMICAAEFSQRKNQSFLVEAAARLKQRGIPHRMILAGEGELFEPVKSLAVRLGVRIEIRLPGFVKDLAPYYYASDVLVSASRSEGLPFQIMEAMACSLPVVATNVKGHRDLVVDGETGFLFAYDDLDGFCDHIQTLYQDKTRRTEMGKQGEQYVHKYNLKAVLPENLRLLYPDESAK